VNWIAFISEQWMLLGLLAVLAAVFFWNEGRRGGKTLNHSEVTRMLNNGEAVLVDLREPAEFKAGHIVGAINIPHNKMETRSDELEKHRSKNVVLTDKMGQHSGAVGKNLGEKGYNVYRLRGGMAEWNAQNLPVVKS
jgi:rhodanese-related sulfurtransferase